ncbi:MMPL family transporter [Streptomyces sp. NPDC051742]|uniref:MMPL family transporter n=1 Tax=unclassified Streptomyces TaxID=2593676 RepID=UPI00343ECB5E
MRWLNRPGALVTLLLCLALAGIAGPCTARLGEVTRTGQAAELPPGAESARAAELLGADGTGEALPLAVVWTGSAADDRLTAAQRTAARRVVAGITGSRSDAEPVLAEDGKALTAVVAAGPDHLSEQLGDIRKAAGGVPGTDVHLAGPAAAQADLDDAFAHTDGTLLAVTLTGVLLILLLVYRSVFMPLLVIAGALLALASASALLYALARAGWLVLDGQVQGIVFVLVIGASTDYALLLAARYKEELARPGGDTQGAVVAACRATAAPVLASAATVACAMMTLTLSTLPSHQALGPAVAIAMACCAAVSLTFLPALLLLCGPRVFWPRQGHFAVREGWVRLARATERRPRRLWCGCLVLLLAGAAFAPLLSQGGVPLHRALPAGSPSAIGQTVLARHFPAGTASPLVIVTPPARTADVRTVTAITAGVAAVKVVRAPAGSPPAAGRDQVLATLAAVADSEEASRVVERLRVSLGGTGALVGGQAAYLHDVHSTALRDQRLIMPVVFAVVLVILIALLRCLLLPLLLVAAAGVSLLTAFGVSALAFGLVDGSAATEPAVVLFSFIFLVALGVDYNIFLVHRVRHEARETGTAFGVRQGLVSTGGVISAAGLILAATFAALTVMPLLYLAQIGCVVAVGVLIDTLLVRLFLVPALILDLGHRTWWPAAVPEVPWSSQPFADEPEPDGGTADEVAAQMAPTCES